MFRYLIRRLLFLIPTLFGITLVCFLLIHLAPGGPIERAISKLQFSSIQGLSGESSAKKYSVSQEVIDSLKKKYGFDKPVSVRYFLWIQQVLTLDFGESFVHEEPVIQVILSRLPVSLQFGIISFFLVYLISIPLGIYKAIKDSSYFDISSSFVLTVLYALPPVIVGILLKTYFTGSAFVDWFPVGDLHSDEYFEKNFTGKILDRVHHFVLPSICYMVGSFTILTLLMKNSLLECIHSDYVRTAYAKGLYKTQVIFKHALKNALIPVVTGLGNFLQFFLVGSLIIEKIFNLNGIGLLVYESAVERDFHVLLALIFFQSILSLISRLVSDLLLPVVDPRITFSK